MTLAMTRQQRVNGMSMTCRRRVNDMSTACQRRVNDVSMTLFDYTVFEMTITYQ